jgi:cell wall-associated NlpC family hydrolase
VAVAPRTATVAAPPRVAPAKPRVAVKPKAAKAKPVAKSSRRSRLSASKARKRELLRTQMGLSPAPMPPTVIAPVSPAELLRARDQYLSERKARLNPPASQSAAPVAPSASPGTPVGNLAPLPPPSGPLGGASSDSAGTALPPAPPALQPMKFSGQNDASLPPLYPLLAHPTVVALSQIKPKAPIGLPPLTVAPLGLGPLPAHAEASAAPGVLRGGSRGGSLRGGSLRGGSPRDRFGSGMANQALSYRGMRYIRGAASPSRGFDCSGLIYFLLRQRGYNPPRTAAGYRNWGQSVPRGKWQPGDLVLFANTYKRGISHIGVYLGQNKFVHAATSGTGVRVSSLSEKYYAGKYFGARRAKMPVR